MICKLKDCNTKVGRHTIVGLCDAHWIEHKRRNGKRYRDKTTKSISRPQLRGGHERVWMVCGRSDCNRWFWRQPYQHEKWSYCPRHKAILEGRSAAINWVQRESIRSRRVG